VSSESDLRIAIIGSSGSGKTTLARRVGEALAVPFIELDAINWQAGWRDLVTGDPTLFVERVEGAVAGKAWVCDGNYRLAMPAILRRATDVIWLDFSKSLVMRRVIARSLARSLSGAELWPGTGNREDWRRWLDKEHPIRWAWDTFSARRRRYEEMFADPRLSSLRLHRLRRPAEAKALLARWEGERGSRR
jgi:adenylate kinase family enzyme